MKRNCSAEKGAFTGANTTRDGRFARAHGGTLFLDEVGELAPHVQVKLLRVLQSGEFERLGGSETLRADCRIIAATGRDLEQAVKSGDFRRPLPAECHSYDRPTTERRDDVPLLADHFIRLYAEKNNKSIAGLSAKATEQLVDYSWPGNVRELEDIERAVVLAKSEVLDESTCLPTSSTKHVQPMS